MRLAAEPAGPVQAAIVQWAVEAVTGQRFRNETSQTFHSGLLGSCAVPEKKEFPWSAGGQVTAVTVPRFRLLSHPGGGSGSGHRIVQLSASGIRRPERPESWLPRIKVAGAGPTDREARAPYLLLRAGPSHLWLGTDRGNIADCSLPIPPHSREAKISVHGIAKLLPPVVHVKRETL